MVKKSGSICRLDCHEGWGETSLIDFCVYCNQRCVSCYETQHNCSSCKTSGNREGFMVITDFDANTGRCYENCPDGTYKNFSSHVCDVCDPKCLTCDILLDNCTACATGLLFLDFDCLS